MDQGRTHPGLCVGKFFISELLSGGTLGIYGIFRPFWTPQWQFRNGKRCQHTALDVPCFDPTLIHAMLLVWSLRDCLWPYMTNLWHFLAILDPYGAPRWQFWNGKMCQHTAPDVSYLDPTWIHQDPAIWSCQGRLWPEMPDLWHFGVIFGPPWAPRHYFGGFK